MPESTSALTSTGPAKTVRLTDQLQMDRPGWLALRISRNTNQNEFGEMMFAHTSAIYVDIEGKRIFDPKIAHELITEIEGNIKVIMEKGKFADDAERARVLRVHRAGIEKLRERIAQHD